MIVNGFGIPLKTYELQSTDSLLNQFTDLAPVTVAAASSHITPPGLFWTEVDYPKGARGAKRVDLFDSTNRRKIFATTLGLRTRNCGDHCWPPHQRQPHGQPPLSHSAVEIVLSRSDLNSRGATAKYQAQAPSLQSTPSLRAQSRNNRPVEALCCASRRSVAGGEHATRISCLQSKRLPRSYQNNEASPSM